MILDKKDQLAVKIIAAMDTGPGFSTYQKCHLRTMVSSLGLDNAKKMLANLKKEISPKDYTAFSAVLLKAEQQSETLLLVGALRQMFESGEIKAGTFALLQGMLSSKLAGLEKSSIMLNSMKKEGGLYSPSECDRLLGILNKAKQQVEFELNGETQAPKFGLVFASKSLDDSTVSTLSATSSVSARDP
ncbi:MAG: hypothetical protein K0S29_1026 [Gammaproteobacteria bacterium]|jgi:hypothetical protein|nr:hypothetical protein [Gammaproteobacteria bacterium]